MAATKIPEILPGTRILCEALAERLEATKGVWTLEIRLAEGLVQRVFRHEQLGAGDLERFDFDLPRS